VGVWGRHLGWPLLKFLQEYQRYAEQDKKANQQVDIIIGGQHRLPGHGPFHSSVGHSLGLLQRVTVRDKILDLGIVPGYISRVIRSDVLHQHGAVDTALYMDDRGDNGDPEGPPQLTHHVIQPRPQSNFGVQKANIEEAQVHLWKAQQDYDRYKNLYDDHVITKAQFDQATADKESAQAALDAAKSQIPVLDKRVNTGEQQTSATASIIATRKADVEYAQLQLSYTVITAPASGIVSKRNIQIGQLVQAGSPMFSIVHDDVYVTANFKETQMNDLKLGQKVDVDVNAFPGQKIQGIIESVSGATGAKFSLLPPDNATGNFVKVVLGLLQRVPVRIKLDVDSTTLRLLRPGMSVDVTVHTK